MITKEERKIIRKEGIKIMDIDGFKFHRNGEITAMISYFYRLNMTPRRLWEMIQTKFPNAELIDKGDHFAAFYGGAKLGSAHDSFIWVKFR